MILGCQYPGPHRPTSPLTHMSRKPKKGYFVSGKFVAEGSELDLELKRELKGGDEPSRTDRKHESLELQKLGEALQTLRPEVMTRLGLSEKLIDAVAEDGDGARGKAGGMGFAVDAEGEAGDGDEARAAKVCG